MSDARDRPRGAWTRRHLLGLRELSAEEILAVLDTARGFSEISGRSIRKVPTLRGRVVVNAFYEPSTRTRLSFSLAAQRLSADVLEFSKSGSSTAKGETLIDTARNIEAMGVDAFVLRHSAPGAAAVLARHVDAAVVNAGDGAHEHPTQALLDLYTIREHKQRFEGLEVAIVGDISHSRVARSNIWALQKLGARVTLVGPPTLVPSRFAELGCEVSHDLDAVIPRVDVLNMLRIQRERQGRLNFPSTKEYSRLFALTERRLERAKSDVLVMHPGPINRGVEISPEVADGKHSVVLEQVSAGVAVRMAVLFLVVQAKESAQRSGERPALASPVTSETNRRPS
ncbi:MAG: aspartate carbamoyltransferase catalytic subunit [Planctomycetota bacterium]|nr:MAG: aspartate carbamoyltransferase catalytic subunit [Planctomycetota bacterium]